MNELIAFSITIIVLTAAGFFLLTRVFNSKKPVYLFAAVPILLIAAASTYTTITGVMGWPTTKVPDELEVFSYRTNGQKIWFWGVKPGDRVPRTFVVPYSKQMQAELEKGEKKKEANKGEKSVIKRKPNGSGSEGEFQQHEFQPLDSLPPKE